MENFILKSKGRILRIEPPQIWGIINHTPDSFYAGSRRPGMKEAFAEAENHIKAGADVIDIGAMSSRPGAIISKPEEELSRVLPLLERIKSTYPEAFVSIDTIHSSVAEECVLRGADIINDITGGVYDPAILQVAGKYDVPIVIMHMRGTPATMQIKKNTQYENLVREIMLYFKERVEACLKAQVKDIILDPGFGFSKTIPQNMMLLSHISSFKIFDFPVLIGVSRKSTIYKSLNISPEESLNGTTALHMIALNNGASILRVHDVKEAKEAVSLYKLYNASVRESEFS